jgi:hypothetical protein
VLIADVVFVGLDIRHNARGKPKMYAKRPEICVDQGEPGANFSYLGSEEKQKSATHPSLHPFDAAFNSTHPEHG